MPSVAERMLELFRGCDLGHGTYREEDRRSGSVKSEIRRTARTLRGPATVEMWEQHLRGERPLGVIPIDSRAESWWGVIDVDSYVSLSHRDIATKLQDMRVPMHVCRSKSGGAHIFLFVSEPVSAAEMVDKLRDVAAILGHGEAEVFPKQVELLADRGDLGNWLNMPYFDMEKGTRYAVDEEGRGLSIEKFLARAEASRLTIDQFQKLRAESRDAENTGELAEGPPCLQHLSVIGVQEGGRNKALFAYGVLAKKMQPDNWEPLLQSWNQKFLSPPLGADEVGQVTRQLRKKDYNYRCKDQPIASHCDAQTCRTRRFGVGEGGTIGIASISYLDTQPALYFVYLSSGQTVECTTDDLISPRAFQRAVLDQLHEMLPLYRQDTWTQRVQECLRQAVVIEAPADSGTMGHFMELFEQFCTDKHRAQAREEVILGKPWLDDDGAEYWFRLQDLMAHLERSKFREYSRGQVMSRIRKLGGKHEHRTLRGHGTNMYRIPAGIFAPQQEGHSLPRSEEAPI